MFYYKQTDRQTDQHTHTLTAILCPPTGDKVGNESRNTKPGGNTRSCFSRRSVQANSSGDEDRSPMLASVCWQNEWASEWSGHYIVVSSGHYIVIRRRLTEQIAWTTDGPLETADGHHSARPVRSDTSVHLPPPPTTVLSQTLRQTCVRFTGMLRDPQLEQPSLEVATTTTSQTKR